MAFKLKYTNVKSMLEAPKMYEEQPKNMENVLAGKDAAQGAGPMMYEEGPKLHDEFTKKNNIDHGAPKSKGPHAEKEFNINSGKAKQEKRGDDPSKITSDESKSKGPKSHVPSHIPSAETAVSKSMRKKKAAKAAAAAAAKKK